MPTDRYVKTVLTIIAAALVWLCVRDLMPIAHASGSGSEQSQSVAILASDREPVPVKIVAIERTVWNEKKGAFETVSRALPWQSINVSPQ